jgi:type I restriction enzyme S subunit
MRDIEPILRELKARLQELYGERLKGLYLFGSYARGDAREDSDIDVLMVLDDYEYTSDPISETSRIGSELSLKYDCLLSMIPMREADWQEREDSFLTNVRGEGVLVA